MLISSNVQTSLGYQTKSNDSSNVTNSNASIKSENGADKVIISDAGFNAENKWQEIANKYDPANMSYRELSKMSSDLELNGLITSAEGLALRAPPSREFSPDKKYDTVALAKRAVEFDQLSGGIQGKDAQLRMKALDILEKIQNFSSTS